MNSTDIEMILRRADAADKRMQHLQEQINREDKAWRDVTARLDNSAAAHADEFAKLEKRCAWLEQELIAAGKTIDMHEADIQKIKVVIP